MKQYTFMEEEFLNTGDCGLLKHYCNIINWKTFFKMQTTSRLLTAKVSLATER